MLLIILFVKNNKQYDTLVYSGKIKDKGNDKVYSTNIKPIISNKPIDVQTEELRVLETANVLLKTEPQLSVELKTKFAQVLSDNIDVYKEVLQPSAGAHRTRRRRNRKTTKKAKKSRKMRSKSHRRKR